MGEREAKEREREREREREKRLRGLGPARSPRHWAVRGYVIKWGYVRVCDEGGGEGAVAVVDLGGGVGQLWCQLNVRTYIRFSFEGFGVKGSIQCSVCDLGLRFQGLGFRGSGVEGSGLRFEVFRVESVGPGSDARSRV